jgi:hypothetical protein
VTRMGYRRGTYEVLVGRCEGKRPLGRPRHGRRILECILKKWDGGHRAWNGLIWLRTGTGGGLF